MRTTETSRAAYESVKPYVPTMEEKIIAMIKKRNWTCDELEQHLDLKHQSCSACITKLQDKGVIEDSGIKRKTRSGRLARAYRMRKVKL